MHIADAVTLNYVTYPNITYIFKCYVIGRLCNLLSLLNLLSLVFGGGQVGA